MTTATVDAETTDVPAHRDFTGWLAGMAVGLNNVLAIFIIIIGIFPLLALSSDGASFAWAVGAFVVTVMICGNVAILGDIRNQMRILNSRK